MSATTEVTQILSQIEKGDPLASGQLLPLVYDELRKLASARLANESPRQTLQATALVHEAYIRLVDIEKAQHWDSRGHFFAAAAEAMRRILVENARRKQRLKHGGNQQRVELNDVPAIANCDRDYLLDLDAALRRFAQIDPETAELIKLRIFAGLTNEEAAIVQNLPPSTAKKHWMYARSWLRRELGGTDNS
jgi:RNA polymerase sigma factor (TIGR02999 family)